MVHLVLTDKEAQVLSSVLKQKAVNITEHIMSSDLPFPYSDEDVKTMTQMQRLIQNVGRRIITNEDKKDDVTSDEWAIISDSLQGTIESIKLRYPNGAAVSQNIVSQYTALWEKINIIESKMFVEDHLPEDLQ